MTKQELEEVFYIRKEIQDLEKRIDRIEKQSKHVSDVVQNGYKRHAVVYGVDVKRAYKLQINNAKLRKFKIALVDKVQKIEDYIEIVPFSEIRQILRYRYLDNFNWIKISHKMNDLYGKDKYTADSVRMKHDRYLKNL